MARLPGSCTYNGMPRQYIAQYVNLDSAELSGVDSSFSMPLGRATLSSSYTYPESEITTGINAGQPLNDLPKHMGNLGVDWAATDQLKLWSKARYKSETIEAGTDPIPAYTLVDIGAAYQVSKNLRVAGGIYNLFDREVSTENYNKTLDGRRLYVSLTADF